MPSSNYYISEVIRQSISSFEKNKQKSYKMAWTDLDFWNFLDGKNLEIFASQNKTTK